MSIRSGLSSRDGGVAFLAAGAIIQARGKVHGVHRRRSLAGRRGGNRLRSGPFSIAILAAFFGFAVLVVLRWVEAIIPKKAPPPVRERIDD